MTNFEHYKETLSYIVEHEQGLALRNGFPVLCDHGCGDCDFADEYGDCSWLQLKWLLSEYEEPNIDWDSIPVDTKVLVSNDGNTWYRGHFSRYDKESGNYLIWRMGFTSFTAKDKLEEPWKYIKLVEWVPCED